MRYLKNGFTLVELIVVVTILAILSAIGFVAYSGYLSGVRDTNRISQLKSIHDGLVLSQTKADVPLPDENIEIVSGANIIGYQGFAGSNVIDSIEYTSQGVDPKDKTYFTYSVTSDRKYFSLMAFLENDIDETVNSVSFINNSNALNYALRIPYVEGKKVGIFLNSVNTPVQEDLDVVNAGNINLQDTSSTQYQVYLDNTEFYSGDVSSLTHVIPNYDCKRIKDLKGNASTGVYSIDPNADGVTDKVYCDMTTDGGGWTYATLLADENTENLFSETNSGNNEFITSLKRDIYTKGKLSNVWVDDRNRDILLQCFSNQPEHKNYETPVIIYDFIGTEKSNLTKNSKQNTEFSSENLNVKWKNKKFIADKIYEESSSNDAVMGISTQFDRKEIFYIQEDQLAVYEYAEPTGPAFYDPSNYTGFSSDVYCLSAIR